MTYNRLSAHLPPVSAGLIFGIRGVVAATLAAVVIALPAVVITMAGVETANAQCRKNYYPCSLNRGGKIDPANPGCCWSPAAGAGNRNLQTCPSGFYKCDLNKDGPIDPKRPGCCLSDIRLKHDVVKLGTLGNGIGIYRFRYNWSDQAYVGVMACAVKRRRFPVGARPTRQPLQPEATGAVMEVTKWLKPSDSVSRYTVTARVCRP